jgi:hypothetical protein
MEEWFIGNAGVAQDRIKHALLVQSNRPLFDDGVYGT